MNFSVACCPWIEISFYDNRSLKGIHYVAMQQSPPTKRTEGNHRRREPLSKQLMSKLERQVETIGSCLDVARRNDPDLEINRLAGNVRIRKVSAPDG